MDVSVEIDDAVTQSKRGGAAADRGSGPRGTYPDSFKAPMPPDVLALQSNSYAYYLNLANANTPAQSTRLIP
jgi:hypothetical protein